MWTEGLDPVLGAALISGTVCPTTRCPVTALNPSEAAKRLGVSAKALRLYEQRGLVTPMRTAAGWRVYGPGEMARLGEIVALRALGLSLGQAARVLGGDAAVLDAALAAHQSVLEGRLHQSGDVMERVRADLASGKTPAAGDLALLTKPHSISVAFDLPWPWGGERFELADIKPLTHIVGPLGSGKTQLAMRLAETLPDAVFLGLDRSAVNISGIDQTLSWLVDDGATVSDALIALLAALETHASRIL